MSEVSGIQVELKNAKNDTIYGSMTIEGLARMSPNQDSVSEVPGVEKDPQGAGAFVATVILVYAIAVVFLIASHVFVKKKEDTLDYQMKMVEKYWEQSFFIRERGARESFKKLKHSMVPAVAKSTARDLISRRKSFAPILADAGINMGKSLNESDLEKLDGMPCILEESDSEEEGENDYTVLPGTTVNYTNETTGNYQERNSTYGKTGDSVENTKDSAEHQLVTNRKLPRQKVSFLEEMSDDVPDVHVGSTEITPPGKLNKLHIPQVCITMSPFEDHPDDIEEDYLSTAAVNRAFQRSPVSLSPLNDDRPGSVGNSLHALSPERNQLLPHYDTGNSDFVIQRVSQSQSINPSPYSSWNSLNSTIMSHELDKNVDGLHHVTF